MQRITNDTRRERGVAMLTVVVALTALFAAAALAIDAGMVFVARTQAQNVSDAAALAAAYNLVDKTGPTVTLGAAEAAALGVAGVNNAVANASVNIDPNDIVYGNWDLETESFDTGVDLGDPDVVTAVQVTSYLTDAGPNNPVPAFMARILGLDNFDVSATAIAYLGFAGSFNVGEVDLPIAIDCCQLAGSDCKQDYCAAGAPIINECPLVENPYWVGQTATCLEFHNTAEQNACWTNFESGNNSVNTADLTGIVRDRNTYPISVEEPIHVDNGDKTPVIGEIEERMMELPPYSEDEAIKDYDGDGINDSWVVRLPVVECQTDLNCAGGNAMRVVGAVCFEILEMTVTPDKIIRGNFMCDTHPRWSECDLGITGSGGLDFNIRADLPVLVQ